MASEATDGATQPPKDVPDALIVAPLRGHLIGQDTSQFSIAEWSAPGALSGPPQLVAPFHVHHGDDEAWYILEGTLTFRLGDREVEATAGTAVFAPQGLPHTYWNAHPSPARYLLIMSPNLRQLIEELHQPTNRDPAVMAATYRRHNSALLS